MSVALTQVRDIFKNLETGDGARSLPTLGTMSSGSSRELIRLPVTTTARRIVWPTLSKNLGKSYRKARSFT